MSELTIITNKVPRQMICGSELTEEERKEFGYMDSESLNCANFVRYKENVYSLNDFMATRHFGKFWHGYISDSFFSGVLIHLCQDGEFVIMGHYYS